MGNLNVLQQTTSSNKNELPKGWRKTPLRDLALQMFGGGTPSTAKPEYWDGDQPWTTTAIIEEGDIFLSKFQRSISKAGLDNSSAKIAPKGSVLIGTRVGVGKAVVTTFNIAINQDLTTLIPNDKVLPEFLVLSLKEPSMQTWFENHKRGSTIKGVPREDLAALEVLLPPLPEQRAVAHVLRTVQRAKETTEKVIAATRQLKQSLMRHLFIYGPVPFEQADRVKLQETELGTVPEQWCRATLGELCAFRDGAIQTGPFGSQLHKADYMDSGVPVVNPTHLLGNRINHINLPRITTVKASELARHRLRHGDVLFARRGEIGRHGFVTQAEEGWLCGTGCFLVRVSHPEIFNAFLPWYFSQTSVVGWLEANAAGAIMPNLNNTTLARLPVFYPMLPEQRQTAAQLAAVDAKLAAEETRREALDALFQSLLHHLMTGKVRVPLNAAIV